MDWFSQKSPVSNKIRAEVTSQAGNVAAIFGGLKMVKTASGRKDLHFYVDPKLAENFNINLHLVEQNDRQAGRTVTAGESGDFREATISFPSKQKRDPNYLCSVVLQKPEDEVYAVSAYLMETYLGRYAYKSNWYFRKKSGAAANRCYERVLRAVEDLKTDVIEGSKYQSEVPALMKRALQGEAGEVEPKDNKMATYLNPANVAATNGLASENIVYIPKGKSLLDDLDLK